MKQRKLESLLWQKSLFYGGIFIFVALVILYLWYYNAPKQEQRFCEDNPEKCACTIWTIQQSIYPECVKKEITKDAEFCTIESYKCSKFRKKNETELDIDDCNNNPREDEKCKCVDYNSSKIINTRQATIEEIKTIPECNLELIYDKCIKSRPKTDWEKHPENYHCILWKLYFKDGFGKTNHTYIYTDKALKFQTNEDFLNDIKSKECIEWVE